ncbi:MAG: hypothetical protein ACLSUZ_01390 [Bifidobacterium pseudocatenulatum]
MSENGATTVNAAVQSSAEPLSAAPATSPNGIEHTLANGQVAVHDPQSSRKTVSTICSARIVGARAARIWCIGSGSITI